MENVYIAVRQIYKG